MHPLAVGLVLVSAVIHAWREMITKKAHDKQIFVWLFCVVAVIILFPILLYEGVEGRVTGTALLIALGASVIHSLYWYFMSRAYEAGDLSQVYPIMRSSPALIFVLSVVFLGEQVSALAVLGVVTILAGIYTINMKRLTPKGLLEPLKALKERHTRFAILTALAVTAYSIQDKLVVQRIDPFLYNYLLILFPTLIWTPFILKTKSAAAIVREWKRSPRDIVINAVIAALSYSLILKALTFERVSYITSLRQVSIVVGVLLGGHLLKEKHKWIRLCAAGLILAGTAMIAFAK